MDVKASANAVSGWNYSSRAMLERASAVAK